MGGGALGGNAQATGLAQRVLDQQPSGVPSWISHEIRLAAGESLEHNHEFAFVYAMAGVQLLQMGSVSQKINLGEGSVISSGEMHRHDSQSRPSVFWEIRLAPRSSAYPTDTADSRLIFESGPLEGIPNNPLAAFVHVLVPRDGQTSVHTHPGPEFIYQLSGRIEYENGIIGTIEMGPGAIEGMPPKTPVQKRNPFEQDAVFLSWFLVDTAEPFASPARFLTSTPKGKGNVLAEEGGRVVGVSSIFGGGDYNSMWGANNAIDSDPTTEWSSDGDNAWIEIELPAETHVTSLGLWTRTMGSSAQIFSFRVVTDSGEMDGPFKLSDAAGVHYFDTDLTGRRLRFEAVETSGGNTGVVDIEVYGEPAP